MPYSVNNFSQTNEKIIDDYKVDETVTTTPVVGQYVQEYASLFAESFLWLNENFASSSEDIHLNGNIGDPLRVEAAPSPPNPINGQLWWDYGIEDLKVYNESLGQWTSLTGPLAGIAQQHYDNQTGNANQQTVNPHQINKNDLGLGNVNNVPAYDSSKNFSEYQEGDPLVNLVDLQNNIDVYAKSDQYNKTEITDNFLTQGGTAENALLLNGLTNADYVKIAGPFSTDGIDGDTITSGVLFAGNNSQMGMQVKPSTFTASISNNRDVDLDLNINFTQGSSAMAFKNEEADANPIVYAALYDIAGVQTQSVEFYENGIRVSGSEVYSEINIPTAAEIGALELHGTAVDTKQLAGVPESVTNASNTIVKRDSNGVIIGSTLYGWGARGAVTPERIMFKQTGQSTANSEILRSASKTDVQAWSGINNFLTGAGVKAWAVFLGSLANQPLAYGCSIIKTTTGQFLITLNTTPPGGSYTAICSPVDDGAVEPQVPSSNAASGYRGTSLKAGSAWITGYTANSFLVDTKRYQGRVRTQHWDDSPWDNTFQEFRSNRFDGLVYALAIYY